MLQSTCKKLFEEASGFLIRFVNRLWHCDSEELKFWIGKLTNWKSSIDCAHWFRTSSNRIRPTTIFRNVAGALEFGRLFISNVFHLKLSSINSSSKSILASSRVSISCELTPWFVRNFAKSCVRKINCFWCTNSADHSNPIDDFWLSFSFLVGPNSLSIARERLLFFGISHSQSVLLSSKLRWRSILIRNPIPAHSRAPNMT